MDNQLIFNSRTVTSRGTKKVSQKPSTLKLEFHTEITHLHVVPFRDCDQLSIKMGGGEGASYLTFRPAANMVDFF